MKIKFGKTKILLLFLFLLLLPEVRAGGFKYHPDKFPDAGNTTERPASGGIKEIIPNDFQSRYSLWKEELLSTEFGKSLWETYSNKEDFILTIRVTDKESKGAGTVDFLWNERGRLAGATINLGGKLDKGFPDPIYYPVMNSISDFNNRKEISGITLAATKFAHEFGHVNLTLQSNQEAIQLENKLIPLYNSIFLKNGFNTKDRRLIELANQMGGTPTKIWENREYWGEATAMNFILEKTQNKSFHCTLVGKINENVSRFAKDYEERFVKIAELNSIRTCEK